MSTNQDQIRELLAAAAAGDISDVERAELDRMISADPSLDREAYELAAAAATLALVDREAMPESLRTRLLRAAEHEFDAPIPMSSIADKTEPSHSTFAWGGWLAAAACFALAAVAWLSSPRTQPEETRAAFVESHPDALTLSWQDWDNPEIAGVTGDVVWSEEEQRGYLRLVGLPENDPGVEQYQLWIIDGRGLADENGQSARISGAIFDSDSGEVIVPIDPAIPVQGAGAFAITIERPGGVWASDMSRRVVIAAKG